MERLTAPYNFVPLNKYVYVPSWAGQVSHDIPFEDGEDGWIEVTWKNVSPLIVKDKAEAGNYSMHVVLDNGKRKYFIPGTSLKGMLRSVLEILSYGRMTQYNNRFFGHREFDTKLSEGKSYQKKMSNVKWGWLKKEGEEYFLLPCTEECDKISVSEVSSRYSGYNDKVNQWDRNLFVAGGVKSYMFPTIEQNGVKYRLYCTGQMNGKKHEILVPEGDESGKIRLDEDTVEKFMTVHEPTPDFEEFADMLDDGYSIPVSYIRGRHGNDGIYAIGLSKMLRDPYMNDINALVRKEQKPEDNAEGHDLCETIFGWSNKGESIRGRVQVGSAFCNQVVEDLLDEVKGVLGEPKPSFYPLYLKQDGNQFKTYEDANGIAGRKLYRIHRGDSTMDLPQGNDNENVKDKFRPLPAGLTFVMRINVHNLKKIEIGALLSAITLHKTEGVFHNVGSAKSFGYGKIKCEGISLHGLEYNVDEYIKAFESEMSYFSKKMENQDWANSMHVNTLVNILSEHDNEEMEMMTLEDGYKNVKNNKDFNRFKRYGNDTSMLREGTKRVVSLLNEEDKRIFKKRSFKDRNMELFENAEALLASGELEKARRAFDDIIDKEKLGDVDFSEEKQKVEEIEAKINEQKQAEEAKRKAEELAAKQETLSRGLKAMLDELKDDKITYKVETVGNCNGKVKKWLKDSGRDSLTEQETADYCDTLRRLRNARVKKEEKDWKSFDSKLWKSIKGFIGEDMASQLYSEG